MKIIAIVDPDETSGEFIGINVVGSFEDIGSHFDAVVITDLFDTQRTFRRAAEQCGSGQVLAPALLGLSGDTVGVTS